jgi:hypothetical protein
MNAWMLPFALVLIIIGLIVAFPVMTAMQPAMTAGIAAGGNATWLPYVDFQNAVLSNMKWIALVAVMFIAVFGGLAIIVKTQE